jgi:thiosulfate/3-mercaptopyruvate sulfurtransferase
MLEPFVDPAWLRAHRHEVVLVDVRFYLDGRSGRQSYERGHLPGAVYCELEQVLSEPGVDPAAAGRHPLPTPERFAAGLAALGVGDGDPVVAYDDSDGIIAARLVWLLRVIGHDAALLDGGLERSRADLPDPGELETGPPPTRPVATFTARPWPAERFAHIDELASTDAVLIDARDPARFGGGPDPVDPRSGHIPGARNVPVRPPLGPAGTVGSPEQLRARFDEVAGIGPGTEVVSYCGSGVSACLNLLALERAGLRPGRLFPGSWSQWSRDPARPIET